MVADTVTRALTRSQADLEFPVSAPRWIETPVLDGLAVMARELHTRV